MLKIFMLGIGFMALLQIDASTIRRIYYKIEGKLNPPKKLPPESGRKPYDFPEIGYTTSVETALNSRCTSDYNGNQKKFHWGMFDPTKKLSQAQIKQLISLIKLPRFTGHRLEVQNKGNEITFIIDNHVTGIERDWLMIESGMQQQAIGLVCAALGAGMVFKNMGQNGRNLSEAHHANIKIKIDAMKPSYGSTYWSSSPPGKRKPWLRGNLPNPKRVGEKPLIPTMAELKISNKNDTMVNAQMISQLLWAARGRTPHLYKSREWGMTIPTWGGELGISNIHLLINQKLYNFINWYKNRPTQRIELTDKITEKRYNKILNHIPSGNCFIILSKNETKARSSWEIGYQLFNMLLQAHALDISYEAILLNEAQKQIFKETSLSDAAAVMLLSCSNSSLLI